jgi:hypothetical protein
MHAYRLCGLVVKVPGYRSRGPGINSQHYQIFWSRIHSAPVNKIESYLEEKFMALF